MDFFQQFPITTALIAANLVASLIAFTNRDFYEQNLFRIRSILKNGEWHRTVTSAFLHVSAAHLLVNMFVLYMFGGYLEARLGTGGYLLVYFAALIGASLWMLAEKRGEPDYSAVGASGAVSGVVLGFCVFEPFAMLYLFFAIPMPAIVFGIGYIVISYALSKRDNAIVAHGAHLGGALAGLAATLVIAPGALAGLLAMVSGAGG